MVLHSLASPSPEAAGVDPAATCWVLISCALVLLMTPGLAFFYGGLVRAKNALNTMMMSYASLGVVGVTWAVIGYSLAFGGDGPLIGGFEHALLVGVGSEAHGAIPHLLFMAFQGTFAIITAALISGAVVERMRFGPYLVFICVWTIVVYAPVCHWVWGDGGWIAALGALDFAGGTVVHINAAVAAVVAARLIGARRDYGQKALLPHNVPFTLLGAGLLWFGWFGFNAGSALSADALAVRAFANTMLAPAAALVLWMLLDLRHAGKTTAVGLATGIVVGLVAITPAAGFVAPWAALLIGALAVVPSYYAILWRARTALDDSLDVAAAHGLGGLTGALLVAGFATTVFDTGGVLPQLGAQLLAVVATIAYSGLVSFGLLKLIGRFAPLRADRTDEAKGLDVPMHGEEAIATGEGAILLLPAGSDVAACGVGVREEATA